MMDATRIPPPLGAVGLTVGGLLMFGVFGILFAVFAHSAWGILLAVLCLGMAGVYLYRYSFAGMGTYITPDGVATRNALGTPRRVAWDDIKRIDVVWRGGLARLEYTRIVYGRNAEMLFGPLQRDRSATALAAYLIECAAKHAAVPAP